MKRVIDVVFLFKNDTINVGNSRLTLPVINRTKNIFYPHNNINFLIGEGKEILFMGIKEHYVNDADVISYLEKSSFIRGKKIKKIFVSLRGASSTARLIAKENKLIFWDREDFSQILRVYHKPICVNESSRSF